MPVERNRRAARIAEQWELNTAARPLLALSEFSG